LGCRGQKDISLSGFEVQGAVKYITFQNLLADYFIHPEYLRENVLQCVSTVYYDEQILRYIFESTYSWLWNNITDFDL
jgi:hypothetical protein